MRCKHQKFYLARVAHQLGRFEDSIKIMKDVVEQNPSISEDQFLILSSSFKNRCDTKRNTLENIESYIDEHNLNSNQFHAIALISKETIDSLQAYSEEIELLVDNVLIPACKTKKILILLLKLKADHQRYYAERLEGNEKQELSDKILTTYNIALSIAQTELSKANTIYLSIALNYCIALAELADNTLNAIDFGTKTFQNSIKLIDSLDEDEYNEAVSLLQLINQNVLQWKQRLDV